MGKVTSTNYTGIAYVKEVVPGETPATPTFKKLPITSSSLESIVSTVVSETLRDDRQTDDLVAVDANIGGEIGFELSYEPWKEWLISALQSTDDIYTVDQFVADTTLTSGAKTLVTSSGDFTTLGLVAGIPVLIHSPNDVGVVNQFVTPLSITPTTITVAEDIPDYGPENVSFVGECWANGSDESDSYTIRRNNRIPGGAETLFYDRGCRISAFNWNFATGSILTGSFTIIGLEEEVTETPISGETITPTPDYVIMNAVTSLTDFEVGGLPTTTEFNSMTLNFDNQINPAKAIGTLGAVDMASFTLNVTGNVEIYFEDRTLYNLFLNAQAFSIRYVLVDGLGNKIMVYIPKCKFETLSTPTPGKDQFLFSSGSYRALRDSDLDKMFYLIFAPRLD